MMASGLGDLVERSQQIVNQFETDRVALIRTVQRQSCEFAFKRKLNCLVCHRNYRRTFRHCLVDL